jgi:hypothetical protein
MCTIRRSPNGKQLIKIFRFLGCLAILWSFAALSRPAAAEVSKVTKTISLDGDNWLLAIDPENVGREQKWFDAPRPDAKKTKVPWFIQDVFPGYGGVAWYWRDVEIPANPHEGGRYVLRFWDVDYTAEVWVNGKRLGGHEGAQTRFELDATDAIKPGEVNRIAVRVLSIWDKPIDGFIRGQTPHGGFRHFNFGGILDSVELRITPPVRTDDLFVRADPKNGTVRIEANVQNAAEKPIKGKVEFTLAPATGGEPVGTIVLDSEFKPGKNEISTALQVANPRLWELDSPYLYRATARISPAGTNSVDESSTRFGFRDFRFENGYFRLNGKRVFWRFPHTGADSPGTIRMPFDPGLLRRDILNLKAMGFNTVRYISIMAPRFQLDMCDELGMMALEECHVSWMLEPSPQLAERMNSSLTGMVLRDRNHPSVVAWQLLNETGDGPVFRQAYASLSLMRKLDDTRMVLLGSGRFDAIGLFMNGLEVWKPEGGIAPCVTHNPKDYGISCVTLWKPKTVTLLPGLNGEYSSVRWSAPAAGEYKISAQFRGNGTFTTTDLYVLQNGKPVYESFINKNGRGDICDYSAALKLAKGDTLDFAVGGRTNPGGAWYERWGQSTSLAATIAPKDGKACDLQADFSNSKNPSGPWSYGWLAAAPKPDASTFKPYPKCEPENTEELGGICNPGSNDWEKILTDQHYYPRVPHRELDIARLRTITGSDHHLLLSEYGIGSAVNLPRTLRHFEQVKLAPNSIESEMSERYAAFMADWQRLKMSDTFASPEDYFDKCLAKMAGLRKMGLNALRSNPNLVGTGVTSCQDPLAYGEGLTTLFRELKPGTMDAIFDSFYPVRWCTFAETVNVYRGGKVRVEAVLSNEDTAAPGEYPARLQIVGPEDKTVFERKITVTIPGTENGKEPAFAIPVFDEEIPIDGPTGKYRFLVTFERGVPASGGEAVFYVTDPAGMPKIEKEVVQWGDDPDLTKWLKDRGIKVKPYQPGKPTAREVILVSSPARDGGSPEAWRDLAERMARGSTVIFLTLDVFQRGDNPMGWVPLAQKGGMALVCEYTFPQLYNKDEWAKKHPLFDGLPCGGLMDYTFYREIIPDHKFSGQPTPDEVVAGSFRTSCPGFAGESMLSVYNFGSGRFYLNSLRVRQALGQDPTAERLLRNMLRYAARDADKPLAELPADFEAQLKAIGYAQ